jgi:predicted transcriptional regulator
MKEIEYFKSLRQEIHIRIQEHSRLVWLKIISLGVMIYFLIGQSYDFKMNVVHLKTPLLYLAYIIPLTAVIFDFMIAGNLRVICNIGCYIKTYIENESFVDLKDKIQGDLEKKTLCKKEIDGKLEGLIKNGENYEIFKQLIEELKNNGYSIHRKKKPSERFLKKIFEKKFKEIKEGEEYKIVDEGREFIVKREKYYLRFEYLKFGFWEEKAAQAFPKYRCYTLWDVIVIWLFTFGSGIFSVFFRPQKVPLYVIDIILIFILVIGIFFAIYHLIRSIKMIRRF